MGEAGDELLLIRKGLVRISLPLNAGHRYNVTTFAQGDFFGDMAFLDKGARSADAVAEVPTQLFVISRRRFDEVVQDKPLIGNRLFAGLARALAIRLRYADSELRALQAS
jgi:sulfate permease, SulP family